MKSQTISDRISAADTPVGSVGARQLDPSGMIRRVRRLADLSQRDLAESLGLSAATIAKWESGSRRVELAALESVLGRAGLRLAVLDEFGREIRPVDAGVVRDNGGRHFPAHLDVQPPDVLPQEAISSPRYDRQPAKAWYHLRRERDVQRAEVPEPVDHPTAAELRQRRLRRIRTGRPASPQSPRARADCECPTACWLGRECSPSCTCQCEPA